MSSPGVDDSVHQASWLHVVVRCAVLLAASRVGRIECVRVVHAVGRRVLPSSLRNERPVCEAGTAHEAESTDLITAGVSVDLMSVIYTLPICSSTVSVVSDSGLSGGQDMSLRTKRKRKSDRRCVKTTAISICAKIIHADGEFQASERLAQAGAIIAREPTTLQLRYLQTLTEIASEKNSTIIFPLPIELFRAFGIQSPTNGDSAKQEKTVKTT